MIKNKIESCPMFILFKTQKHILVDVVSTWSVYLLICECECKQQQNFVAALTTCSCFLNVIKIADEIDDTQANTTHNLYVCHIRDRCDKTNRTRQQIVSIGFNQSSQ